MAVVPRGAGTDPAGMTTATLPRGAPQDQQGLHQLSGVQRPGQQREGALRAAGGAHRLRAPGLRAGGDEDLDDDTSGQRLLEHLIVAHPLTPTARPTFYP